MQNPCTLRPHNFMTEVKIPMRVKKFRWLVSKKAFSPELFSFTEVEVVNLTIFFVVNMNR